MRIHPYAKSAFLLVGIALWDTAAPFVSFGAGFASLRLYPWASALTMLVLLLLGTGLAVMPGLVMNRYLRWDSAATALGIAAFLGLSLRLITLNELTDFYLSKEDIFRFLSVFAAALLMAGMVFWRRNRDARLSLSRPHFLSLGLAFALADILAVSVFRTVTRFSPLTPPWTWASLACVAAFSASWLLLTSSARRWRKAAVLSVGWSMSFGAALAPFLLSLSKPENKEVPGARCVFLVSVDTLRRDALSCYGNDGTDTPHMDSLAGEGLLYKNAISPAPWTQPALASLLTGLSPSVHLLLRAGDRFPQQLPTVAEAFKNAGYKTAAIVAQPVFGRPSLGFSKGFQEYIHLSHSPGEFSVGGKMLKTFFPETFRTDTTTEDVTHVAIHWLSRNRRKPFFLWIHYYDPHLPYAPPPASLRELRVPDGMGRSFSKSDWVERKRQEKPFQDDERRWIRELYLAEVRHVDQCLGRVLDAMRNLGLFEESLLVLTSDHGEEFWEHGGFEHGHTLHAELLRMPLIVKWPGSSRTGEVDGIAPVEGVGPALLAWSGIGAEWPTLAPPLPLEETEDKENAAVSTGVTKREDQIAVQWDQWKYVEALDGSTAALYDLSSDPEERVSVLGEHQEVGEKARQLLSLHQTQAEDIRGRLGVSSGKGAALRGQDIGKLKDLGYLE